MYDDEFYVLNNALWNLINNIMIEVTKNNLIEKYLISSSISLMKGLLMKGKLER